LTAKSLVA
jgi:hypothetical protein